MKRVKIIVQGSVQGVFFRYFIQKNASSLGLKGTVKNLDNDKVEIIVEGEENRLKALIQLCQQGPPAAEVEKVDVEYQDYEGNLEDFSVDY
ncbi:acylphosphatase [Candidatus Woesearchaeota archaeon]|nr:acylphosphatase [Candidatus Woesearchaeota archaeon]